MDLDLFLFSTGEFLFLRSLDLHEVIIRCGR
jgi:hypothetical protein